MGSASSVDGSGNKQHAADDGDSQQHSPDAAAMARRRRDLGLDDDDDGPPPAARPRQQPPQSSPAGPTQSSRTPSGTAGESQSPTATQPGPFPGKLPPRGPAGAGSSSGWSPGASFQRRRIKLFSGSQVGSWRKGQIIGKGATGAVYEAIDEETGGYFAVKQVEFAEDFAENPEDRKRFDALRAEVALLQVLDHPNIVRFLGVDRIGFNMFIMMEFVAGGSIGALTKRFARLPEELSARYTSQLVAGLSYLHEQHIVHRDIKGANVLVSDGGVVKLADFGAARQILDPEQLQHTLAGTPYWMAPEVVRQQGHGTPADVWSLGATVLQMLTGKAPYQDLAPVPALFKIGHGTECPIPPDAPLSPEARDFINQCLNRDAARRPQVHQLKQHPWLQLAAGPSPPRSLEGSAAHRRGSGDSAAVAAADELEVADYLIALSFHHDDDAASLAMQRRSEPPSGAGQGGAASPNGAGDRGATVGAVTFDGGMLDIPDEAADTGEFDDAQFDEFVNNLGGEGQTAAR